MIARRNRACWWSLALGLAVTGADAIHAVAAPLPLRACPAAAPVPNSPATAAETIARLSEIKVQLAWLANPETFACPLKVRSLRDTMLEVSGTVPSAEIRSKALAIAGGSSQISILDTLSVGRVTLAKAEEKTPAQINFEATHALTEPGFQSLRDLQVRTHPDGLVVLLGSAGSYEEKLLASQRVRRVPGCRGVDNQMEVRSVTGSNGRELCAVSADGRLSVPAEPHVAVTPAPVAQAPKPSAPAPAVARPSAPPSAIVITRRRAEAAPGASVVPVSASMKLKHVDSAVTRAIYEARPAPGFAVKPLLHEEAVHAAVQSAPVIPVRCTLPEVPKDHPRPISVTLPAEPGCIVATPIEADTTPAEEATTEAKPIAIETNPTAPESTATKTEAPHTFASPAPGSLAEWFRQRIAQECALEIDAVSVSFPAPTDIRVSLKITDRAAAGRMCTAVTHVPELAPYHLKIEVDGAQR